jgi:uncharacterized protein
MKIRELIWKQEFVDKLATKHGVTVEEVEDVFDSVPHVRKVGKGRTKGEDVYAALGQTVGGRYLIIYFIRKLSGAILPISARDMDGGERNYYGKQKESY